MGVLKLVCPCAFCVWSLMNVADSLLHIYFKKQEAKPLNALTNLLLFGWKLMANAEIAVCVSLCVIKPVSLCIFILIQRLDAPVTNFLRECKISSYLSYYLTYLLKIIIIKKTSEHHISRCVFSYRWNNILWRCYAFYCFVCYLFLLFLPNTSCLSSGFLLPCVIVALVLCLIGNYNMPRDLRCFVGMQKWWGC